MSFLGCSSNPRPKAEEVKAKSVLAEPVWFNVPNRFNVREEDHSLATHPFFDLSPFRTKESLEISYYLTTPQGSAHEYEMDMVSGQNYRKRTYCSHKDIWKSYSGNIDKPSFNIGIIPRLLDQTGVPQSIWVFSDPKKVFSSKDNGRAQSQRARVVGGVLLQYCKDYPCRTYTSWLSRLVLIGVNSFDPKFKDVRSIEDLKKKVDFKYVKAFAENAFGRKTSGPIQEPAYRLLGEMDAEKALSSAFKLGHLFEFNEINSLRKNCFYLYDYIWRSQKKVRANMAKVKKASDNYAKQMQEEARRIREIRSMALNTVFQDNIRKDIDEDEKVGEKDYLVDFQRFFLHLHNRYGDRVRTCMKFVRPSSIKENRERTWFFAFVQNWFNLENLDYYYLCPRRSWLKNYKLASGKRRFDPNGSRRCSNTDLDESFESGVNVMSSLASSSKPHYRFIEYDYGIGGSHDLLFSWVYSDGKKLGCDARKLEDDKLFFPEDISWKPFDAKSKRSRFDVIR